MKGESSSVVVTDGIPFPSGNPLASRALSAFEFCFGAFIVIGAQRFPHRAERSDRPFCARIDFNSAARRQVVCDGIETTGIMAADSSNCACRCVLRILLGQFLIEPVTGFFWPKPTPPALANEITGNVKIAVVALLLVWTFAAFGEEIAYRGYLLTRAADIGRRSAAAYWIGIVLVSILFGYGHYYKGASGVIDSGVAGLILGTAYMLAGRNLWASILAHGFIDTFGVIDAFFGWSN